MANNNFKEYVVYVFLVLMIFNFFFFFSIYLVATMTHFEKNTAELTRDFVIDNVYSVQELELYYTFDEVIHLDEVRKIYHNIVYLMIFEFFILFLIVILFKHKFKFVFLKYISKYLFVIVIIFFIIVLIFYKSAFVIAHKLLFNSVWQFPSDSLLINLFPFNFWFIKSVEVFVLMSLFGFLFYYSISPID